MKTTASLIFSLRPIPVFAFAFILSLQCVIGQETSLKINAKVTGFPEGTMFFIENISKQSLLDSAEVDGSSFVLEGSLERNPEIVHLYAYVEGQRKYSYLMLGNEEVSFQADISEFPFNVKVTGSKTQDERKAFWDHMDKMESKSSKIREQLYASNFDYKYAKKLSKLAKLIDKQQLAYYLKYPNQHNSIYG